MNSIKVFLAIFSGIYLLGCSADNPLPEPDESTEESIEEPVSEIETKAPVTGVRIAWDFNTMVLISEENDTGYNGYPRVVQLDDGTLLVVYESNGDVVVKRSVDKGLSWSNSILVAEANEGVNMATPDITQLDNGAVLLAYNPRPGETAPPSKRFLIKTILSNDGGVTWQNDQVIYEGGTDFANGVWEPSALQLPNGEIQLFFSNETPYTGSNEQNISMLRSGDNGITWTEEPEIVSFRTGSRDGMPAPLFLEDKNEIIFSIEDNGNNHQFKPYIIRNSISENWARTVDGKSENRNYALKENLEQSEYAGAPYLAQLKGGATLLSYQGTDQRNGNDLNNATMKVAIGTETGRDFNRISTPFLIPEGKSALWSSIEVLNDNSVVALTTTNAFSATNASQVWMIKGRIIPELRAVNNSLLIDGETSEDIWNEDFPIFIGHKGETQLTANVSADAENLYVLSKISDGTISVDSGSTEHHDGMVIYLDPLGKNYTAPGAGVFKIVISAANQVSVYEGENSGWHETEISIESEVKQHSEGYVQEISIPWSAIGGRPDLQTRIGFNLELLEKGNSSYRESIPATDTAIPYTWLTLRLN